MIDIYCIYNKTNNKRYVGQTKQGYRKRFIQHLCPKSGCPLLNRAIKKYGKKSFESELLDVAETQEIANIKEKMWIRLFKTYNKENGYNLSLGGVVGSFNNETLKKMSDSKKGSKNSFYKKHHTKEAKIKMSEWKKANFKLGKHPQARPVKCVETGQVFDCVKRASQIGRAHV